jgi:hypothetical protein
MNNEVTVQKDGAVELPGDWKRTLAEYAEEARSNERASGTFFSTKGGILSFGNVPVPNNTMDVIAIGSLHENVYYKEAFGGNVQSPNCYAFSLTGTGMVPHAEADDKQAEACDVCPHSKWNSDPGGGKGKACKQMRRVAFMPEAALESPEAIAKATVGYLRIPVTSVKNWSAHVQSIAARGLPPFAVVTRVRLVPDAKTMFKAEFSIVNAITDTAALGALAQRFSAEKSIIDFPYAPRDPEAATNEPVPAKGKGKGKF